MSTHLDLACSPANTRPDEAVKKDSRMKERKRVRGIEVSPSYG